MGHGGETGGRLSSPSGVVTSHGGKQRAAGRATPVICVFYIYGVHLPKLERRPQTLRDNILPLDLDLDTQVQSTRLCRRRGLCVTLCFCSQTKGNSSFEMKSGGKTCKAEKLVKRTLFNWFRRGRHLSLFCLCSNSCHYAFFCLFSSRYFISSMSGWESFKEFRGLWKETTWEERLCSLSNPFSCFFSPFNSKGEFILQILLVQILWWVLLANGIKLWGYNLTTQRLLKNGRTTLVILMERRSYVFGFRVHFVTGFAACTTRRPCVPGSSQQGSPLRAGR